MAYILLSGLVTGLTAQKIYPEKSILIITEEEKGLVPCGIPYIFHDLDSVEQDEMGLNPFFWKPAVRLSTPRLKAWIPEKRGSL
jgi:hypothetical protein